MTALDTLLSDALKQNKLEIEAHAQTQLIAYLDLLHKWNRAFNLTNIIEPRDMVYLHLIDSLLVAPLLHGKRMIDIGSGAGLPGIPLAIVYPETEWVLLDKNSKKTRFLTQAIAELGLKNVSAVHSRSEDFHPTQGFDTILSRALGTIAMFLETTAHLLNPNGIFLAMKGKYPQEELTDISEKFIMQKVIPLHLNGMDVERHVIRIQRTEY